MEKTYEGIYDRELILKYFEKYNKENGIAEGFVCRLKDSFNIDDFSTSLSKFVKSTFVIPDQHWRHTVKTQNRLASGKNPWDTL